jgi:hypothetical protein
MTALRIRKDRTSLVMRKAAKAEKDPRAAGRMPAIANALEAMSRADAARAAGMERRALRDAVTRHNGHALYDRWGVGAAAEALAQATGQVHRDRA